jgi:hypothetical protein
MLLWSMWAQCPGGFRGFQGVPAHILYSVLYSNLTSRFLVGWSSFFLLLPVHHLKPNINLLTPCLDGGLRAEKVSDLVERSSSRQEYSQFPVAPPTVLVFLAGAARTRIAPTDRVEAWESSILRSYRRCVSHHRSTDQRFLSQYVSKIKIKNKST